MNTKLKEKLLTLPQKPGVYLHKNKDGKVIYVGKAINLFNRVNSYFRGAHDYKTTKLVSEIEDFDYIVVSSEKEALVLEYNLIKEYDPKFNIVFKDDKSYPYILLQNEEAPYLSIAYINKKKVKGKYYGPYPNVTAARSTVALLNSLYETRKCKNMGKEKCLYFHMHQCPGYCTENKEDEGLKITKSLTEILSGKNDELVKELKKKMKESSENLDFEKAQEYKLQLEQLQQTFDGQSVQKNNKDSFDAFNYYVQDGYIAICGLFVKNGKIQASDIHLGQLVGDPENYCSSYVYHFYQKNLQPKVLYLPNDVFSFMEDSLNSRTIVRGFPYRILKKAQENAKEHLLQNKRQAERSDRYLSEIQAEFERIFHKPINHIEIFDNSHTGGKNAVGGMVVYKNYRPSKKDYRMFKLEDSADDFSSMKQMLIRRYSRLKEENGELPDLIIVDGAMPQITAAKEILDILELDITIVGLGKDDKHNTSYMMNDSFEKIEIDPKSNLFFFLTNMQDEVHRFAVTYHRKLRAKAVYSSPLDNIKGLGPKTKKKLMSKYKTISKLRELTLEELSNELGEKIGSSLYEKLHLEE